MYSVEKHINDFKSAAQRVKICDLEPLRRKPVELWEETICGHFFRAVLYIGDSGKYFASFTTALNYLDFERTRKYHRHTRENPVKQYYTE